VKVEIQEGSVFKSKSCGDYKVTKYNSAGDIDIEFVNTGYVTKITSASLRTGSICDKLKKTAFGVGYIGDGPHRTSINGKSSKCYLIWRAVLSRCYNQKDRAYCSYGQRGVRVCDSWLNFQNFAEWFYDNHVEGYELDKDILFDGNLLYSPDYCRFIPKRINLLLRRSHNRQADLPVGVAFNNGSYSAFIRRGCGSPYEYLGCFRTPEDAHKKYKEEKEKYIKKVAADYYQRGFITKEIRDALFNFNV